MPRCIIHIGHPKTASTLLQTCMHLNHAAFADSGYWVPDDFRPAGYWDCNAAIGWPNFSGNLAPAFWACFDEEPERRDAVFAYMFGDPSRDLLLSTELIFYFPDILEAVVTRARQDGFDVTLLAYLQRQDHAAVSGYLQNVKNHGESGTAVEFIRSAPIPYFKYYDALSAIARFCDPSALIVRTYEAEFLVDSDILADFVHCLDARADAKTFQRPAGVVNGALQLEQYEVLRALNRLQETEAATMLAQLSIEQNGSGGRRHFPYYYTEELRNLLISDYLPDNGTLLNEFFGPRSAAEREYWMSLEPSGPPAMLDSNVLAQCLQRLMGRGTMAETDQSRPEQPT